MIIGISGKIGSGKDTVGKIIQYHTSPNLQGYIKLEHYLEGCNTCETDATWEIKKFADKLKDIVCLLISCTREQLEDQEFKNTELGEEWNKWSVTDTDPDNQITTYYNSEIEANQALEDGGQHEFAFQPIIKLEKLTPRLLLQLIGTECGRNIIHPNIWVNSLMSEYKIVNEDLRQSMGNVIDYSKCFPQWIITDMRFPNELQAVKKKGSISIRVERPKPECTCSVLSAENCMKPCDKSAPLEHESETALDKAEFDYIVLNNGTIEDLIGQVKRILVKEKIIK